MCVTQTSNNVINVLLFAYYLRDEESKLKLKVFQVSQGFGKAVANIC